MSSASPAPAATAPRRAFIINRECWYARPGALDTEDSVLLGLYGQEGETAGEFLARWVPVAGRPTLRLEVFQDAFAVLHGFADLTALLARADLQNLQPAGFVALLLQAGFEDLTPRKAAGAA